MAKQFSQESSNQARSQASKVLRETLGSFLGHSDRKPPSGHAAAIDLEMALLLKMSKLRLS
jgi:hypothetical protein